MNKKIISLVVIAIGCMFVLSFIPQSEAKLWDFLVDVEFLKNPISHGKNPIVMGTVVDHAYRPASNVDVKVTFAGESYLLKTDRLGEFGKQLDASDLKPRAYSVHIFASTTDGKKGMARATLEIEGHTEKAAKFERQLHSLELANDLSKLRNNPNDPISVILYQRYLELQESIAKAENEEKLLDIPQQKIREARQLSLDKLKESLDEHPLVTRQFDDSSKLGKFLTNLDDEKRILFELQLNSTKIRFSEAQIIMKEVLMNGGTQDEARQAYHDYLSITQSEMNLLIKNLEKTKISSQPVTNSTEN